MVGAGLLFLPQLLLALVAVLDYSSRDSLKILFTQPALILLPVFTPFTFSRISRADNRVKFSVSLTFINIGISFVDLVFAALSGLNIVVIVTFVLLFVLTVIATLKILRLRGLSPCCNNVSPRSDISVFEPAQPGKHFVLNNSGDIVEKTDKNENQVEMLGDNNEVHQNEQDTEEDRNENIEDKTN